MNDYLLNSSSPLSELPTTWKAYETLYQSGKIDLNDPPPPPSSCEYDYEHDEGPLERFSRVSGHYIAPTPAKDFERSRKVEGLYFWKEQWRRGHGEEESGTTMRGEKRGRSETTLEPTTPTAVHKISITTPALPRKDRRSTTAREDHTGLQYIADLARKRFGSTLSRISLIGRTESIFIAQSARERPQVIERSAVACDHVILKASQSGQQSGGAMVVLDFKKDWRFAAQPPSFNRNSFWAASPIFLPPTFADLDKDAATACPIGVLCIVDAKPRKFFSEDDREVLGEFAKLAGTEIRRMEEEKRERNMTRLRRERDAWRFDTAKRRQALSSGLETVVECEEETNAFDEAEAGKFGADFETTFVSPVVPHATRASNSATVIRQAKQDCPPAIVEILDLSTRLISETLELSFVYFISLSRTSGREDAKTTIRVLSSFNDRSYHFDLAQHQNLLRSKFDNLLFLPPPPSPSSSSSVSVSSSTSASRQPLFSTGIVTKVISKEGDCFLLGAMSDDEKRVLQRDDLAWLQGFAQDLKRYI